MVINSKLAVLLLASCGVAFGAAVWTFLAGFGFLAALAIYSFGGAALLMALAAFSVAFLSEEDSLRLTNGNDLALAS